VGLLNLLQQPRKKGGIIVEGGRGDRQRNRGDGVSVQPNGIKSGSYIVNRKRGDTQRVRVKQPKRREEGLKGGGGKAETPSPILATSCTSQGGAWGEPVQDRGTAALSNEGVIVGRKKEGGH